MKKNAMFNTLVANCDIMLHYIGLIHLMPIHPNIGSVGYVMDVIFQKAHGKKSTILCIQALSINYRGMQNVSLPSNLRIMGSSLRVQSLVIM